MTGSQPSSRTSPPVGESTSPARSKQPENWATFLKTVTTTPAKEEQGKMEGRILHLESILNNAEIVELSAGSADVVAPGTIVAVVYEGDDEPERMLVGSIEEQRDDVLVVSPGSPLGEALLGSAVGDTVSFEAPGGTLAVEVVAIER
ncbi:MAG: hypothetical protein CM1200mP26_23020 [Acidimicrobiales bacterium]|nr:MAG: hypothetical protein CM1200mP26_23020 [Acidimicrobiales bacterium]